jgi:hypothetical protein
MQCYQTHGGFCYTAILPSCNGWRSGSKAGRCGTCPPTFRLPFKFVSKRRSPTLLCIAPRKTIVWKLSSRLSAETKLWLLGSRIMGAHSIRPSFQPPVPASLAEANVGNLGIRLMRSFASDMHYERRDSRNRLTMRFVEVQRAAHQTTIR